MINAVSAAELANEGALAVLEERRGNVRPGLFQQAGWRVSDQRTYGDTELSFLSYEPADCVEAVNAFVAIDTDTGSLVVEGIHCFAGTGLGRYRNHREGTRYSRAPARQLPLD